MAFNHSTAEPADEEYPEQGDIAGQANWQVGRKCYFSNFSILRCLCDTHHPFVAQLVSVGVALAVCMYDICAESM